MDKVAVLLLNPKFSHNVGGALRACACFEADILQWTGPRVGIANNQVFEGGINLDAEIKRHDRLPKQIKRFGRLPREERIKDYQVVDWGHTKIERPIDPFIRKGYTPVCIEVLPSSESLVEFEHPDKAVYVFGPEDGDIPKGIKTVCHRFVTIPTVGCLNLAVAVNLVLYDRLTKST